MYLFTLLYCLLEQIPLKKISNAKMINELNDADIIITSEYDDKGHPTYKLPLVTDFIKENYVAVFEEDFISSKRNKRIILKKNNSF